MVQITDVQPPGTEHPAYAEDADLIRSALGRESRHYALYVPVAPPLLAAFDMPAIVLASERKRTLDIKRAVGPAPFVGEPFEYRWKVAVDELGRQVGGESWIEPWDYHRVFQWEAGLR